MLAFSGRLAHLFYWRCCLYKDFSIKLFIRLRIYLALCQIAISACLFLYCSYRIYLFFLKLKKNYLLNKVISNADNYNILILWSALCEALFRQAYFHGGLYIFSTVESVGFVKRNLYSTVAYWQTQAVGLICLFVISL